ncbi:hypothetical protein [Candidatus Soleaferrea massiliensis]|uniref:hypothetical protein n=1 Tax=Candidatus Soleaferrea massiliensis TaxID=1470354 RepID=UPI0012E0AA13|nr:hypothetical protein [Candidatus Soleaferrea massiliensis]
MKKAISCLLLLSMLTMTGCTGDEASVSQNLEDNKSSTESVSFDIPDIVDPYYNPYNERTATDGEYLYYCTFDAICKMPLQGGETDILYELSDKGSYLWSIALHGPYLYFIEGKQLYRIQKDGKNPTSISTGLDEQILYSVKCLEDTLYLMCNVIVQNDVQQYHYSANVSKDADQLDLKQISGYYWNYPSSRGIFYETSAYTGNPNMLELYQIDRFTNDRKLVVGAMKAPQYLITDQYIFYLAENAIWRVDLNGKNQKNIYTIDYNKAGNVKLCNYDDQSIYCRVGEDVIYNIDQETGENISFRLKCGDTLDVINGYLYGMNEDKFVRVNKYDGQEEYAPF